jgi:carbonic anhydrase
MRASSPPALLAAVILATACGDSSPASPFTGAASLAEEGIGTSQSPIDIRTGSVTFVRPRSLPALDFRYGRDATLDVVNTGSPDEEATVRADITGGGGELRVGNVAFQLLQFHFHTPSEHRINGEEFPLEMHLVHRSANGELMVVGVLVRQGDDAHRPLNRIFDDLPEHEGDHVRLTGFPLPRLLPHRLMSVRYSGSLTTAPYTEPVAWVVLPQPIEMSDEQITAFRELFEEGNSREPQPLNGRRVASDAPQLRSRSMAGLDPAR